MLEVKDSKALIPENDLQELWELTGRVEAVKAYILNEKYSLSKQLILRMLGENVEIEE